MPSWYWWDNGGSEVASSKMKKSMLFCILQAMPWCKFNNIMYRVVYKDTTPLSYCTESRFLSTNCSITLESKSMYNMPWCKFNNIMYRVVYKDTTPLSYCTESRFLSTNCSITLESNSMYNMPWCKFNNIMYRVVQRHYPIVVLYWVTPFIYELYSITLESNNNIQFLVHCSLHLYKFASCITFVCL